MLFKVQTDESKLNKLKNMPRYVPGKIKIFGWDLQFTDGPSLWSCLDVLVCKRWNDFIYDGSDPVILDCGANIGVSILNYKRKFPDARITAFEASPDIIPVLKRNLKKNGVKDVRIIASAVWKNNEQVQFICDGADGSRISNVFTGDNKTILVDAIDICEYISDNIDLLKMDIEGAEYDVIHHMVKKLPHVKNLIVECHLRNDEMRGFASLISDLANSGFKVSINTYGEWIDLLSKPSNSIQKKYDQYALVAAWRG